MCVEFHNRHRLDPRQPSTPRPRRHTAWGTAWPAWAAWLVGAILTLILLFALATRSPISAAPPAEAPFGLPFDLAPGPSTWLLGQLYGNTTGAYFLGDVWYAAGQGLHFGLDFSAPCGTPVVSIGDGVVVQPDLLARGSGPHNLIVRYPVPNAPDLELVALYGHLLRRPDLVPGQPVARGQPIAVTGDPDLTCDSRPHLHVELRSPDYRTAYNPVPWIEADWDALMLLGSYSDVSFARDLDQPLRWVRPEDQPDVRFGGPRLNDYARAWPADRADTACVLGAC